MPSPTPLPTASPTASPSQPRPSWMTREWAPVPGQEADLPGYPGVTVAVWAAPHLTNFRVAEDTLEHLAIEVRDFPRQFCVSVSMQEGQSLQVQAARHSSLQTRLSDAFDDPGVLSAAPFNVDILCSDGESVPAHRFALVVHSAFFVGKFRDVPEGNGNRSSPWLVDLSTDELATHSVVSTVVAMMYRGCPMRGFFRVSELIPLMRMADQILLDEMVAFFQSMLCAVLARAQQDFVVRASHAAFVTSASSMAVLRGAVEDRFKALKNPTEEFFCQLPIELFLKFLEQPEQYGLTSMGRAGMAMQERESFLVNLSLAYLRFNPSMRLIHAATILSKVRMAFVDIKDFASVGLDKLDYDDSAVEILRQGQLCRQKEDYYESNLPSSLWHPRRFSMKHSYWTLSREGFLRYRCRKTDDAETKARIKGYKARKVSMHRHGDVRIVAVVVSCCQVRGRQVVDGIGLDWSDGSSDMEGGGNRGSVCRRVEIGQYEGILPLVVDGGEFVADLKFVNSAGAASDLDRTWGPFRAGGGHEGDVFKAVTGDSHTATQALLRYCFLDGIKGVVVKVVEGGEEKTVLTSLHFKLAALTSRPISSPKPTLRWVDVGAENYVTRSTLKAELNKCANQLPILPATTNFLINM